jgi:hypothetical protein
LDQPYIFRNRMKAKLDFYRGLPRVLFLQFAIWVIIVIQNVEPIKELSRVFIIYKLFQSVVEDPVLSQLLSLRLILWLLVIVKVRR